MSIIFSNIKTIFSSEYNLKHPIFAIVRYLFYLFLKLIRIKKVPIRIWSGKKVFWYSDSIQSTWLLFNYLIDYNEFTFLKKFLRSDSIFLDVGANIGYYTVWVSKFIREGMILSFEPNRKNFQRLKENITEINNAIPFRIALTKYNGSIAFSNNSDVLNHIILTPMEGDDAEFVECYTIEKVVNDYSICKIDFIKIDVEGFEIDVLLGCANLLHTKSILVIQLEIEEENALKNSKVKVEDLLELIFQFNYFLCTYDPKSNMLYQTDYSSEKDNYFITHDIELVNIRLN